MKRNMEYIRVELADIERVGDPLTAILYSYLKFLSKRAEIDEHGYFRLDSRPICSKLRLDRQVLNRMRRRLMVKGLIDYIPGKNQNIKPRYKVFRK